jgi:general stress protein CsbA
MELDDLKHIWQQNQEQSISQQVIDNEKVMEMARQQSKDVMTKLRKNLDFDIIVSSLFIPPLIWVLFQKNIATYHKYVAGFFIVYIFVSLYFYLKEIKSYKLLNLNNDLLSTLKFTEQKFSERVKSLVIYNNISLIPLMFYGSVAGAEIAEYYGNPINLTFKELLFCVIFATPIAYFYMKYFIKKLYGEHLKKLKQLLIELEES